ncbi:hypothetical protein CEXT_295811, partial [Caerostris extrusa]
DSVFNNPMNNGIPSVLLCKYQKEEIGLQTRMVITLKCEIREKYKTAY